MPKQKLETPLNGTLLHGHLISFDGEVWRYEDGEIYKGGKPKTCPECNLEPLWCENCQEWHDGCLGHLENVKFCCCGHGFPEFKYEIKKEVNEA